MDITKIIGCRFFKIIEKESDNLQKLTVLKVIGLQNSTTLKVKNLNSNTNFKINKEELENEYTLLEPDAYILFSIVVLQDNINDIVVSMYKTRDMINGNNIPQCVCRQNITNVHASMIRTVDRSHMDPTEVGMCMSIETIPDGIDYNIMTACNSLEHMVLVAAYLDDSLDTILGCIHRIAKYDSVLEILFQNHINYLDNELYRKNDIKNMPIHSGYCRSLKSLLDYNKFMYDFRRAFGIAEIDINLSSNITSDYKLNDFAKQVIQDAYNKFILNEIVIKYDKDIDLDSIKEDKIIICDNNDEIYLITYTSGKEYIKSVTKINSKMTASEKLETIFRSDLPVVPKSLIK